MADAPKINPKETLRESYPKLNQAIDNANEAIKKATTSDVNAAKALTTANSVQEQFNQVIIEGDSSVEAAQARVSSTGTTYTTLKERLDQEHESVTAQLARTSNEIVEARGGETVLKNRLDKVDQKYQDVTNQLAENEQQLAEVNNALPFKANQNDLEVVKSRIDNLISLPEGSTTNDARLEDIKIGIDGTSYDSPGNAVRGQVSQLKEQLINNKNIIKAIVNGAETFMDFPFAFEQGGLGTINGYVVNNDDHLVTNIRIRTQPTIVDYDGLTVVIKADATHSFWVFVTEYDGTGYKVVEQSAAWETVKTIKINKNYFYSVNVKENSGGTVVKEDAYTYLSFTIKAPLKSAVAKEKIDLTLQDGYISSSGSLITGTSGGALYSNPFEIKKGDKLYIFAKGHLTNVAILSDSILNAGKYPVLITSVDGVTVYEYTATEDKTVIVSGLKEYGITVERVYSVADELKESRNTIETLKDYNYLMMFSKIGGVGDSLMSGEHAGLDGNGQEFYIDRYNYSWLSHLTKQSYSEKAHYSKGGLTAKSWLESTYKTSLENETVKCNAYYIGLGTNDMNAQPYAIGTINDLPGTNTFVGYYKQIIELIHNVAPKAKIFLLSLYELTDGAKTYSNMIKSISELYDYCYYIDLISNSDVLIKRDNKFVSWGHFNTLGYIRLAKNIERITNSVIEENISDFAMFGLDN